MSSTTKMACGYRYRPRNNYDIKDCMPIPKTEVAKPCIVRLYKKHRTIIKKLAKNLEKSEASIVREAIEDIGRMYAV